MMMSDAVDDGSGVQMAPLTGAAPHPLMSPQEELLYRGLLLPTLMASGLPLTAAAVTQACVFAAFHLSAQDFPSLLLLGTLLGWGMAHGRGNLAVPLAGHVLYNAAALCLLAKDVL